MINKFKKQEKKNVSPVTAAITGAVVGAGVAIAGAMALKDEKNRKKVKETLNDAKVQAKGYIDNLQTDAKDKKAEIKKEVTKALDEQKKVTK